MADYPTQVKSFTPKADGPGNTIAASHINDLQDEVVAMESALITNGVAHDVKPSTAGGQALGTLALPWSAVHTRTLDFDASTELTIATGAVVVTQSYHSIDTESDAAADDLDTLTASGVTAGHVVIFKAENVARVVTFKNGTGNLLLASDYSLSAANRTIVLLYDGTNWKEVCRSVTSNVIDRSITEQTISSSAAATSVYSYAVPGSTLGTNRAVRNVVIGKYLNNSGGADNFWVRVQFGGTTVLGAVSAGGTLAGPASSANWRLFRLELIISANNATNSQRVEGQVTLGAASGTETDWAAATAIGQAMHSSLAVDTTAAQTLDVTIQLGTSSANVQFKRFAAFTELLG